MTLPPTLAALHRLSPDPWVISASRTSLTSPALPVVAKPPSPHPNRILAFLNLLTKRPGTLKGAGFTGQAYHGKPTRS